VKAGGRHRNRLVGFAKSGHWSADERSDVKEFMEEAQCV